MTDAAIAHAHTEGRALYEEFAVRVNRLRAEGLVDAKLTLPVAGFGNDATPRGVILTLNNVLRLREEGKFRPMRSLDPNAPV